MKKVLFLIFLSLMAFAQEKTASRAIPATEEEFVQDIDRYVALFASPNALISLHALDYIHYFGEKAVPALLRGLKNESSQVRCFSAIALSKVPDKRAVPLLIEMLEDPSGLDLQVLSDDGKRIHSSYDTPLKYEVRNNALRTLQGMTRLSFGELRENPEANREIVSKWRNWWKEEGDRFQVVPFQEFSNTLSDEARYPFPDFARYLKGITICLDPGHGGDAHQIGYKRGPSGNRESESNLRVARYLRDFLVKSGANVLMTRDSDRFVSLDDRTTIANQANADLFISVHHNWAFRYTAQATTIWYHFTPDYNPASMDLARYVFQEFTRQVPLRELDRAMGLRADNLIFDIGFAVLRNLSPEIPGILCELAYFSNLETELKMRDCGFLRQEAYGIFLGLAQYLYAGVPHWKVLQPERPVFETPQPEFVIQLFDGLEERKEWSWNRLKIFTKHLLVELDGVSVPFTCEESKGILRFTPPVELKPGEHRLKLWIMNLHKNHNWPKSYRFTVTSAE